MGLARNTNPHNCQCQKKLQSYEFDFLTGDKVSFGGEYLVLSGLEAVLYVCVISNFQ